MLARLDDEAVRALYPAPLQPPSPNAPQTIGDLLAALATVREKGWSLATDESLPGVESIAVCVEDRESPDGAVAYVASCGPAACAVIDVVDTRTNKITDTRKIAEIGGLLTGLTISGDGDRAYLVSADGITVLCTLTHDVVGTV